MGQESENIQLEYRVKFEDGVRPKAHIYGIDSEANEVYGADVYFGVSVGAGHHVSNSDKEDSQNRFGVRIGKGVKINVSVTVSEFVGKPKEKEGWEQGMNDKLREEGTNVIKIQNPDHIRPAIDRHLELYSKQFEDLGKTFLDMFDNFMEEHPGIGY